MLNKLSVILLILTLSASCHTGTRVKQSDAKIDYSSQGYSKGTVKYWELDGCRYMIELENQEKLNPGTLASDFSTDNLKVWVKYKTVNRMNTCMSGTTVDIIDIQRRTNE